MPTVDEVVRGYRMLRDQKKDIEERHALELGPINAKMERLSEWLHKHLIETGSESIKTAEGTAYLSKTGSVKVEDWDAALQYIVDNEMWHVLEKRLSKSVVETFVEEEGKNFPGTSISYINKVNVRK